VPELPQQPPTTPPLHRTIVVAIPPNMAETHYQWQRHLALARIGGLFKDRPLTCRCILGMEFLIDVGSAYTACVFVSLKKASENIK